MAIKVSISFKENIEDIKLYNYLLTKRDKSNYVKDLIEIDLEKLEKEAKEHV